MRRKKENMWNQVQRFSIRKFSFGVTSALIGTFFLANASMVQAEVESGTDSALHTTKPEDKIGTGKPNENAQPVVAIEDKKVETNVVAEKTEKASKEADKATKEQVTDVTAPKADKSTLSKAIDTLSELLNQVNLDKVSRTSMLEYEGVLSKAKEVFQNDAATQLEVDAQVVKVNSAITIAKSFPKVKSSTGETVAPKTGKDETVETPKTETEIKHSLETVKADLQKYVKKSEIPTDKPNVTAAEEILENISKQLENTTLTSKELTALLEQAKSVRNTLVNEELRATSGARDSRNGQSMGEGVNFRANGVPVEGALYDVKEYISQDKYNGGGTTTGQRVRTIEKTFMTAKYSTEGNKKYITYDVYFQNDGQALDGNTGNAFWFYPPRDLLYQGNSYPVGVVSDAYYERYQKNAGATGTLSENPNNFTQVGGRYTVPLIAGKYQDDGSQRLWPGAGGLFQFDGGPARRSPSQVQSMLKNLKDNTELNSIIRLGNNPTGNLPDGSYSHILNVSPKQNYAYKYHVKMRLRDDVTDEQAKKAGTIAVTTKAGSATEATQAYVYAARGTRLVTKPDAQIDPIQGLTVTKTVGDTLGDPNDPANSGYVRHKENKSFPGGMTWSWQGDVKPTSTAKAGVFKYKVIARYQDGTTSEDKGSGSDGTVTLIVRPTAPTITTAPQYSGTLVSTDRVISGTGAAGATIKVTLQDGSTGTTTVNNQGKWTYTLKANEKLTQNTKQDATIKADNAISVTQTQNGAESEASTVNVQLAKAISIDTPVQAGREITVKAAHDTGRFYVQVYNKNTDRQAAYEYSVKQENGRWVLESGSDKSDLIVADGDNVSEKKFTLRIKDANKKTNFPFKITANSVVKVRSHHVNRDNNPANPANDPDGGWVTASPATNTNPTITVKAPNTRAYTADGSLTMAGLKNLVTVADAEDDADKTVGNRVGDNFNLTIKKGNQVVNLANNEYLKKGDYTLTYTTTDAAGATVTKEHTITVSSLAESKGTSINYPVDTAKVVYGNSDVENGNFKPATKQTFADKLTEVNRGNNNLPTINGTGVTFTPGTTNDKEKVVVATFPDGSTLDISHAKVARPAAPTITPSANFKGDLGSTERSISGTGIAGATVKIDLQGGKTVETTVGSDGNWTYNLKNNEVLTQNYKQDANTKSTKPVSVKQVMHGIESTDTTANVQLSDVITFDEPLQAGRDITLRVPHDAGRFYVIIASKEGNSFQYGINKTDNGWQVEESVNNRPTGKTTTELTVSTTSNPAERVFKLHIKDSNQKSDIPFTMKADARSVMARVHYDNSRGNPAVDGNWTYTTPINTNPTITVKAPNTRNYTADGSLTMEGLKQLVTAADTEDDANNTVGRTAKENLSVTIRKGNDNVTLSGNDYLKKGEYTLTYTTTDAAGATARKEHTITVSSLAESKGASITYPADTAKVVYGNSDVENGNFKPATKQTFANKLTEVNRGNNNLPTINGTGVTFTPGTTNDKEKVVVATFPDGSTLDISHAKVAKPAAPTITPTTGFGNDLSSTERSISGTGIAGATVKIDLQGKTVEAKVGSDGNWTYNLKANEVLTQNFMQNANTKSTNPVSVKQVMHGIESTDTTANVQLSDVITFDEPLQAGRDITLRVPHDAGRFYVVIASKEGHKFQYGINKTANGWQVDESVNDSPTGKTRTELTVSTTSNPAERVFKLHIKDSNQKTDIPFTMKADARSVMARVHYDNSRGNPAAGGNWTYTTPINTPPRITVNAPDTRNYTADGSLTLDGLKRLVTVADTEDDANKTVGRTANENLSVTIRQGNKVVNLANNGYLKKGEYTLTYTTTDAAGVSVTKERTITVSSIPEVSIKAAKDATAQGIVPTTESNKVINSVTIPSNQPQPISKVLKDNGRITEVDGEKVATVVLTYSDNSTKEVTVPVLEVKPIDIVTTFNEKDNTVTIKPNTTVEINDRLQFGIRGKSMALTKTASGYTNSVNDRTITVNQDGSITITLVGEEKFQAGDRIVTRHESNKNGKVDSYETEAFAGLKPVEKVPVINLMNLTPKEKEDVKAAVKKANPSVNTAELEVAANGDVTYRHKGAGVGTSDPTPVITLSQTVRERNDAEKIDPTIATLTRYVKETKHTDEQIKNAITGEHIANKVITGEIPTNGGTVVVKVTYTDGSSENVKVPIIVTPELTPVKNLSNLTNNEKESVKDKIQALNPTATNIVVKNNGETTLTIPDVTTATLTPDKTVVEAQSNAIADPAKTPVVKLTELTTEEKEKVKAEIKKVNPNAKTVEVSDNGTATVTFNDGTTATLTPDKTVVEDFTPVKPTEKVPVKDKAHLTPEEKKQVADKVKDKNPGKEVTVGDDGTVTVTDPTTGISHTIPGIDLTIIVPPVVDIPEFNGAVNGELPDPVELPKVKLIITKWIDEQGNELKPADAKAPAVVGEANEAYEHGEIEGYVFVRTDVNKEGDVVTHIFRKVTPTKPEGNGGQHGGDNKPQSTPEAPTDNTERKPEVVTPDEQPAETENTTTKPKASQNILPNTGTAKGLGIFSAAAASILSGLGLLVFGKKEDEEEDETQNNESIQ